MNAEHCPVTGKRRFMSKREAKAAMRTLADRLTPYQCPHCRAWHLRNAHRYVKDRG